MRHNFEKIFGTGVQKYQTPSNALWRKNANNDNQQRAQQTDQWDNYHNIKNIYDNIIANNKYKSLTADTLNALNQPNLFQTKEVNKTGYSNWNSAFNSTGLNEYFGYNQQKSDYLGPTTWNRNALLTTMQQKHNSAETALNTDSGKIYYNGNSWVTLNSNNQASPSTTQATTGQTQPATVTQTTPTTQATTPATTTVQDNQNQNNENTNQGSKTTLEQLQALYNQSSSKKPHWTDWAPITGEYLNNTVKAIRNNALAKQTSWPTQSTPWLNYSVTDDYLTRTTLKKNQDQALFQTNQYKSADLNKDLSVREQGLKYSNEVNEKMGQLKSQQFKETSQIKDAGIRDNLTRQSATANENNKINSAAKNAIIQANMQLNTELANNTNQWLNKMYTNYGQFKKEADTNDIVRSQELNNAKASLDKQKLYEQYQKNSDWRNSNAYKDFVSSFRQDNSFQDKLTDAEKIIMSGDDEDAKTKIYERLWNESDNTYRTDAWKTELQGYQDQYKSRVSTIDSLNQFYNGMFPYYISNQGIYTGQYRKYGQYQSAFDANGNWRIQSNKSGGKIVAGERLSKWIEQHEKERRRVDKTLIETTKAIQKQRDRDLSAIDKQTLILLKAIFK